MPLTGADLLMVWKYLEEWPSIRALDLSCKNAKSLTGRDYALDCLVQLSTSMPVALQL